MAQKQSGRVLWKGMQIPLLLIILMLAIFITDRSLGLSLNRFGLIPLEPIGLLGIITAPLLHGDFNHLWSNAVPLLVLGTGLFILYRPIALKVLILSWLITGLWTWFFARGEAVHIGSSGVVYALAAYHLTGALVRRRYDLAAFALIVVFFYGSMIWGFFPDFFPERNISWESHLMGAVTGIILALLFRHEGPEDNIIRTKELSDEDSNLPWDEYELEGKKKRAVNPVNTTHKGAVTYTYTLKNNDSENSQEEN
ncbi:MAG: rhomboid family intramembrane serine protease [Marinilabiliales bacterium]|nr:MAG: rhomboid family intramembrane serine protease [Marinilabiliales bacterium]